MSVINQQEIADRLSISRTTVSRCFTNHKGINPKTRAEVFSLAAKLGYQYLQPRSTKAPAKAPSVGVLICSEAETFSRSDYKNPGADLLPGVSEFAQLHHWQTDVHFVSPRAISLSDPSYAAIHGLRKRHWSGMLLMHAFPPGVVAELSSRFSCVSLVEHYDRAPVDCVDVNHYQGISVVAERLRQLGHARIGFFTRKYATEAVWAHRRLSAYVENVLRLGAPLQPGDIIQLDTTSEETKEAGYAQAVQQTRAGVTAWMCAADSIAYDLIHALNQRGFRVPADVSVTGFDGTHRPEGAPQLETVRIPFYEIGFAGSRRLLDRLEKRYASPQEILVECRLQEGETVGPPRGAPLPGAA